MIIPDIQKKEPENLRLRVQRKLTPDFMDQITCNHDLNVPNVDIAEGITRSFVRYEVTMLNLPKGDRQTRKRSLKRVENSAVRLLNALDDLPEDLFQGLEFSLFEREAIRIFARKSRGLSSRMELEFGDVLAERSVSSLCALLIASRDQLENEQPQPKSAYLRDTPLNRLIQDCAEFWTYKSDAIGVYFDNKTDSFSGPFYALVLELFRHYFPTDVYQSEQALGKRVHRAVYAMRGKDIG